MPKALRYLKQRAVQWGWSFLKRLETSATELENERIKKSLESCGDGVGLWGKITITGPKNIRLGNNVHIGANAFIRGEGGVTVGDNTHISRNLVLYTINHRIDGDRVPYDEEYVNRPVVIGKNVWIGMNVCIVPGAFIGDGAVVGMGTVVSGEVPSMSIIGSQKWRVIGRRDQAHYEQCVRVEAYGGISGQLYASGNERD